MVKFLFKDVANSYFNERILTAVKFITAIRTVLVAIAVQRSRDTAMVFALKLVQSAGDVATAQLRVFISSVRTVPVTVTHPSFVDAGHTVLAFEL